MSKDGFKCVDCNDAGTTLAVHHLYYVAGRKCWEYPSFALVTLCKDCHRARHERNGREAEQMVEDWEWVLEHLFHGNSIHQTLYFDTLVTAIADAKRRGVNSSTILDVACASINGIPAATPSLEVAK